MTNLDLLTYFFKWQKGFYDSLRVLFMKYPDLDHKLHILKETSEPVFVVLSNSERGDKNLKRVAKRIYNLSMKVNKPVLVFDYKSSVVNDYHTKRKELFAE